MSLFKYSAIGPLPAEKTFAQRVCLTIDFHQSRSWLILTPVINSYRWTVQLCYMKINFMPPHPVCLCLQLTPARANPFSMRFTLPLCSQRAQAPREKGQITCCNHNHGKALAHGDSVEFLAPPDSLCISFQSGHPECAAEKRRSRKPVWIFCCLPPAAEPSHKEPVSEHIIRLSLSKLNQTLWYVSPDCWSELHNPNTRTKWMLQVLFTSVISLQHPSAASPSSLIMKVCLPVLSQIIWVIFVCLMRCNNYSKYNVEVHVLKYIHASVYFYTTFQRKMQQLVTFQILH